MSKYIIELDDRIKLVTSVGVTENGVVYTTSDYVHNLEELNSDYINENFGELQDEAYQRGLEDAWNAARKLAVETYDGGVSISALYEMFGTESMCMIMKNNTVYDAIGKLKAYEDKQKEDDRIEVGDEVIWKTENVTLIATSTYETGGFDWCDGVAQNGKVYHTLIENDRKTGKHYDIQSILEAMRT